MDIELQDLVDDMPEWATRYVPQIIFWPVFWIVVLSAIPIVSVVWAVMSPDRFRKWWHSFDSGGSRRED